MVVVAVVGLDAVAYFAAGHFSRSNQYGKICAAKLQTEKDEYLSLKLTLKQTKWLPLEGYHLRNNSHLCCSHVQWRGGQR